MTPDERRFSLLTGLAWELRRMSIGSYVTLPRTGEAVLYVRRPGGALLSVLAVQHNGRWLLMWSPSMSASGDDVILAARRIATFVQSGCAA
ncbi:hypothetical protein [Actinomadura sp. 6N118]|uniref:hypothetical protein n=1 Tax=Actinomadura sp. 6N118 TaxID=3375151 RepID=UPI0037ABDA68